MTHQLRHLIVLLHALFYLIPSAQSAESQFAGLIKQLDQIQHKHNIPAYALIISDAEESRLHEVRGVLDHNSKAPIPEDAYFRIGSITKTFIGLSAIIAEQSGQLKLTDPINRYINQQPDTHLGSKPQAHQLPAPLDQSLSITLEQLLEHTAGFQDMSREEFSSNVDRSLKAALLHFAKHRKIAWAPGLHHSYSNRGYGLAGRVIEVATKQSIDQWLTHSIFEPLNMPSATMQLTSKVKQKLAPGYQADGIEPIPYWHMAYSSLGAINIQPIDMAKLIQFYLRDGATHLNAKLFRRIESPLTTIAARAGLTYGYGLGVYQWQRNGYSFYGHGGDADGYLSKFGYQKQAKLGYFLVINSFNSRAKREMEDVIERLIIQNLPPPVYSKNIQTKNLAEFAGTYQEVTARFGPISNRSRLKLRWNGKQLSVQKGNSEWLALVHSGNGLFRYQNETIPTLAIVKDNTNIWFQSDEGNFMKLSP